MTKDSDGMKSSLDRTGEESLVFIIILSFDEDRSIVRHECFMPMDSKRWPSLVVAVVVPLEDDLSSMDP